MARTDGAASTEARLPEALRSAHLARILVPISDAMVPEATARFAAQRLGRYRAAPVRAGRAHARELLRYHELAAILPSDGPTGPATADNGREPAASDGQPEKAEATS